MKYPQLSAGKAIRQIFFTALFFLQSLDQLTANAADYESDKQRLCEINLLCSPHYRRHFCPIKKGRTYYFKFSTKTQDGLEQILARVLAINYQTGEILIEGIHPSSLIPSRWILSANEFSTLIFVYSCR